MSNPLTKFYAEIEYFDKCCDSISFIMNQSQIYNQSSYSEVFEYIRVGGECLSDSLRQFKNLAPEDQQKEAYILLESTYKFRKISRGMFKFVLYTKDINYETMDVQFDDDFDSIMEVSNSGGQHISKMYEDCLFQFDMVSRFVESCDKSAVRNGYDRIDTLLDTLEMLMHVIFNASYHQDDKDYMGKELMSMISVIEILQTRAKRRLKIG